MITITGKKRLDFTTREGDHIDGWSYFYTDDAPEDGLEGAMAAKKFVPIDLHFKLAYQPKPGDRVEFQFNSKGKFCGFILAK